MTVADCNAVSCRTKTNKLNVRQIKVSYIRRYSDYLAVPLLQLKGLWLKAAGFTTNTPVEVRIMPGCIVLTARPLSPEEAELEQAIRQVGTLPDLQRRQILEMIAVIRNGVKKKRDGGAEKSATTPFVQVYRR